MPGLLATSRLFATIRQTIDPSLRDCFVEWSGDGSTRAEGWIAVRHKQERVRLHPERPSANTHHKVEQPPRIATGEKDREPGDRDGEGSDDHQHRYGDVVRNRQEPLHEWQPTVEVLFHVRV